MDEPLSRIYEDDEHCPHCGSKEYSCWDEQIYDFEDHETGQIFMAAIGYLTCLNCKKSYSDGWPTGADRIGDF